jgi:hypothetical protein
MKKCVKSSKPSLIIDVNKAKELSNNMVNMKPQATKNQNIQ